MPRVKSTINPETNPLIDGSKSITHIQQSQADKKEGKRNYESQKKWLNKGKNRQKRLNYLKKWRLKNKDRVRQYRLKNRKRLNESVRQWKLRNPGKVAEYRRTGRLRKQQMKVLKEINDLVSGLRSSNYNRLSSSSKSKVMEIV